MGKGGKGGKSNNAFGGQLGKMFETMMKSGMDSGMEPSTSSGMEHTMSSGMKPMMDSDNNVEMDDGVKGLLENAQNIINKGVGTEQVLKNQYNMKHTKDRLRIKLDNKKILLEEKERTLAEKINQQVEYDANFDIDAITAEIEALGSNKTSQNKPNSKKHKH